MNYQKDASKNQLPSHGKTIMKAAQKINGTLIFKTQKYLIVYNAQLITIYIYSPPQVFMNTV